LDLPSLKKGSPTNVAVITATGKLQKMSALLTERKTIKKQDSYPYHRMHRVVFEEIVGRLFLTHSPHQQQNAVIMLLVVSAMIKTRKNQFPMLK